MKQSTSTRADASLESWRAAQVDCERQAFQRVLTTDGCLGVHIGQLREAGFVAGPTASGEVFKQAFHCCF